MRVLVFGGSFDPPHLGHEALLKAAFARLKPARVLIVPAWQSPFKDRASAPAADRLALLREGLLKRLPAALKRRTRLDLSELKSRRGVYTVETLRRLKRLNPRAELHFLAGSDAAASFHRWKNPGELRTLAGWWCGLRPGSQALAPKFFGRLPGRFPDVSSTKIRRALALGERPAGAAPSVLKRIYKRGLYGTAVVQTLRERLSSFRFEHTLSVARLAEALAKRWGADAEKARLAGLLHDCGRMTALKDMGAYARSRRLPVPSLEETARRAPLLIHSYISADLARLRFGVTDEAVLEAVRRHTLGGPRMTLLDKVLYAADAASEDRDYPGAAALRRLAFADLDKAFRRCLAMKISHALSEGRWLHPATVSLWNSLP